MPPRLQNLQRLGVFNLCLRPATKPATQSFLPIIHTANLSLREKRRKAKQDPYKWAQAQQRKAANVKRQGELQAVRDARWGDPVHGIPTPFVESFDSVGQEPLSRAQKDKDGKIVSEPHPLPTSPEVLGHLLTREEVDNAIQHSYILTKPVKSESRDLVDPEAEEQAEREHEENHKRAVEAMKRIVSLNSSNSKIKRHINFKRCIEKFGRHNTDKNLALKPPSIMTNTTPMPERSGPDTGSSEVQIAILTVKIRKLSQELSQNRGHKDKHNKRNLRVLCHRRQRLLTYMEKKERGSERWTNLLQELGMSPATWKEQISL